VTFLLIVCHPFARIAVELPDGRRLALVFCRGQAALFSLERRVITMRKDNINIILSIANIALTILLYTAK